MVASHEHMILSKIHLVAQVAPAAGQAADGLHTSGTSVLLVDGSETMHPLRPEART